MARLKLTGSTVDIRSTLREFDRDNKTAINLFSQSEILKYAEIVNIGPYFCKNGHCELSINSHPLFFDRAHLNKFGFVALTPLLEGIFRN